MRFQLPLGCQEVLQRVLVQMHAHVMGDIASSLHHVLNPNVKRWVASWDAADAEGEALVSAVSGLATRLASIGKVHTAKMRSDVLRLFEDVNGKLCQRHIEDMEDAVWLLGCAPPSQALGVRHCILATNRAHVALLLTRLRRWPKQQQILTET